MQFPSECLPCASHNFKNIKYIYLILKTIKARYYYFPHCKDEEGEAEKRSFPGSQYLSDLFCVFLKPIWSQYLNNIRELEVYTWACFQSGLALLLAMWPWVTHQISVTQIYLSIKWRWQKHPLPWATVKIKSIIHVKYLEQCLAHSIYKS